jgi:hypothetical protein
VANVTKADGTRVPLSEIARQFRAEAEVRARVQSPQVIRTPWQKPEYLADAFPNGYTKVPLHSKWPGSTLLRELASLGYPCGAILCSAIRGHNPVTNGEHVRRVKGAGHVGQKWDKGGSRAFFDVEHPYIAAAPGKRTTHSSSISKQQFVAAVAPMRLGPKKTRAAFEVVVLGRSVPTVAKRHRLKGRTLESTAYRVRLRARRCSAAA